MIYYASAKAINHRPNGEWFHARLKRNRLCLFFATQLHSYVKRRSTAGCVCSNFSNLACFATQWKVPFMPHGTPRRKTELLGCGRGFVPSGINALFGPILGQGRHWPRQRCLAGWVRGFVRDTLGLILPCLAAKVT